MRILFIGCVQFSQAMLDELLEARANVVGVLTVHESPGNADFCSLEPLCGANDIPVFFDSNVNSDRSVAWCRDLKPDVLFCFGWSRLLRQELLDLAPLGVVGFHPAALPANRGRHPIIWALALGLQETASTFLFLDQGVDSGDIIAQRRVPIAYEDDAGSLYQRIGQTARGQLRQLLGPLARGACPREVQDHRRASLWRKRSQDDGRIDFRMSSRAIYNLVRALRPPYPGAHVVWQEENIGVLRVEEIESADPGIEPGKILESGVNGILVKAGEGAVLLREHGFASPPDEGDYFR